MLLTTNKKGGKSVMISQTKQKGFTIVELLIVIVVIGILAAISIVAYNGIQNNAKNTTAKSLASQVKTKAEAYNASESKYPTLEEFQAANDTDTPGARLDDPDMIQSGPVSVEDGQKAVQYETCGTPVTGAKISYATYPSGVPATMTVGSGC